MIRSLFFGFVCSVLAGAASAASFTFDGQVTSVSAGLPSELSLPPLGADASVTINVTEGVAFPFSGEVAGVTAEAVVPGFVSGDLNSAISLTAFASTTSLELVSIGFTNFVDAGGLLESPFDIYNQLALSFGTPLVGTPANSDDLIAGLAGASGTFTLEVLLEDPTLGEEVQGTIEIAFGPTEVPLPASGAAMILALAGFAAVRRRRSAV